MPLLLASVARMKVELKSGKANMESLVRCFLSVSKATWHASDHMKGVSFFERSYKGLAMR